VRVASAPGIHSRERPACTGKVGENGPTGALNRSAASAGRSPATTPRGGWIRAQRPGLALTGDGREPPTGRSLRIALRRAFHADNSIADPPASSADLPPSPRDREVFISPKNTRRRTSAVAAPADSTSAAGMHRKALAGARVSVAATRTEAVTLAATAAASIAAKSGQNRYPAKLVCQSPSEKQLPGRIQAAE